MNQRDTSLDFAYRFREEHGIVPVILGQEIYEHFGRPATIESATEYQAVINGRLGELTEVDIGELELRAKPFPSNANGLGTVTFQDTEDGNTKVTLSFFPEIDAQDDIASPAQRALLEKWLTLQAEVDDE